MVDKDVFEGNIDVFESGTHGFIINCDAFESGWNGYGVDKDLFEFDIEKTGDALLNDLDISWSKVSKPLIG